MPRSNPGVPLSRGTAELFAEPALPEPTPFEQWEARIEAARRARVAGGHTVRAIGGFVPVMPPGGVTVDARG